MAKRSTLDHLFMPDSEKQLLVKFTNVIQKILDAQPLFSLNESIGAQVAKDILKTDNFSPKKV